MKKVFRIGLGMFTLLAGAILIAACAARIRQGDLTWLPTTIFGISLIFVGYGAINDESPKDIALNFVSTITGSRRE